MLSFQSIVFRLPLFLNEMIDFFIRLFWASVSTQFDELRFGTNSTFFWFNAPSGKEKKNPDMPESNHFN